MPQRPPERLLMGPGPSNPDPRIRAAVGQPMVGHLDPFFLELMDETMSMLRRVFRTENAHTIPMSGTGTAGLETIVLNLVEAGDEVVVAVIGHFGQRLREMVERAGATVRVLEAPWGGIVPPERFEEELARRPAKLVVLVHAETSTGAGQPVADVAEIARRHGALTVVDCVTSLGGMPVEIDAWGVDAAGSCSQKSLGALPGLGPLTLSDRAMEAVRRRRRPPSTWYFDLTLLFQYWRERRGAPQRTFHHTAPVSGIYGFHEALRIVLDEGLESRWSRHERVQRLLVDGLENLGLSLFTPRGHRLPMLTVVDVPEGVDDARLRGRMLERGVEIAGGFGPLRGKVWRIGTMGANATPEAVGRVLEALQDALHRENGRG